MTTDTDRQEALRDATYFFDNNFGDLEISKATQNAMIDLLLAWKQRGRLEEREACGDIANAEAERDSMLIGEEAAERIAGRIMARAQEREAQGATP